MIYYLVTAEHSYTMESYLQSWGRKLIDRIQLLFYEELPKLRRLPAGTYIFSDLERLSPQQKAFAAEVWKQLAATGNGVRLLNHPMRCVLRYQLLQALHESGQNDFRAVRATEARALDRFPVFIREENEHTGNINGLLRNQDEVDEALANLVTQGYSLDSLLVIEFCETSDSTGVYRKYAAFMVGGTIVPRTLIFGHDWCLKVTDLGTEEMLREERDYREQNPDEPWLRKMFNLAGIDYGRIDYGLLGNKPQVWEINTNPMVLLLPKEYTPVHLPAQKEFARCIIPAFEALDCRQPVVASTQISIPPELLRGLPGLSRARTFRRFARRIKNSVLVKPNVSVLARHWQVQGSGPW